jgi:hypothetical protein
MVGPILGALMMGGSLIGSAIQARRNKQNNAKIEGLQQANTGILDNFENQYGNTFDASTAQSGQGATMYANAVGLNGAEGNTAATNAYQVSPGYQFGVDQATQAAARAASAGGMLASGNHMTAATGIGYGMANQDYQQWLGNLAPYNSMHMQGLENKAGLGSLITTGRLENNNAQSERLQSSVNAGQQKIGNMLGFAGNIAGRTDWGSAFGNFGVGASGAGIPD